MQEALAVASKLHVLCTGQVCPQISESINGIQLAVQARAEMGTWHSVQNLPLSFNGTGVASLSQQPALN